MTPYFMVNPETLERTPPEVLEYLRVLRRRIGELDRSLVGKALVSADGIMLYAESSRAHSGYN